MKKTLASLTILLLTCTPLSVSAITESQIEALPNLYSICQKLFPDGSSTGTAPAGYVEEDIVRLSKVCLEKYSEFAPGAGSTGGGSSSSGSSDPCAGLSPAECARLGLTNISPDGEKPLTDSIKSVILTITFVIGIVAVIMIIIGGISYSTSQGDPGKIKKAKDTIMYSLIGLVVALIAFAIVEFVLDSVF